MGSGPKSREMDLSWGRKLRPRERPQYTQEVSSGRPFAPHMKDPPKQCCPDFILTVSRLVPIPAVSVFPRDPHNPGSVHF